MISKKTEELKSKIERTKIKVPCNGRYVTFVYPVEGPDSYRDTFSRILKRNLRPATGDELASLLYLVYCDEKFCNELESKEIKEIMRKRWLWVANINLWAPEGVYVIYDGKGIGRSENLEISDLEKSLKDAKEVGGVRFSKDGKVRFASKKTCNLKHNTSDELSKNGFVIASYGLEGAEKLAEVSTKFLSKPYIYGLSIKKGQNTKQKISVSDGFNGLGLDVIGYCFDDDKPGYSFGVLK